ncbi:MAG: type II toxin-antitoxin system RelE/ParE family toxin [Deltaproteobacteria bacterium]|nr:type II toxin-antitoxin system RelE/ParE family toxin [Deltaproteobacteria bacterium]
MIASFADTGTRDIYLGVSSKAARATLPTALWAVAQRKLSYLEAAHTIDDLRSPPGNHLEKLKGNLLGYWSIRLNDQFRVILQFVDGNASEVAIVDYH